MTNQTICQSCGMPLREERILGTNEDGSKNSEYCHYCYQGGQFTQPMATMNEWIDRQVGITRSKQNISESEAKTQANRVIPTLKRWRKDNKANQIPIKNPRQMIIVGSILAVVIGIIVFVVFDEKSTGNSSGDSNSSFSMLPIWIAIFIPILMAKKKKNQQVKKELPIIAKNMRFAILFLIGLFLTAIILGVFIYPDNSPMLIISIGIFIIIVALLFFRFRKKQ